MKVRRYVVRLDDHAVGGLDYAVYRSYDPPEESHELPIAGFRSRADARLFIEAKETEKRHRAFGIETPVAQLGLSTRPLNALTDAQIMTIGELTACSRHELQYVRRLGRLGLHEIEQKLASIGRRLRPEPAST